jgi:hypothetical protein
MMRMIRLVMFAASLLIVPGCLVVTVHPTHQREDLVWDPALIGTWRNADDNSSVVIERGEWTSYKMHYQHPIETGDLTGYLTTIGKARYMDLMPAKGEDHGSFLLPIHVTLRVKLEGDRLEVTAMSYDWFFDRLKTRAGVTGLNVVLDAKENALIASPTTAVRAWIARQPAEGKMFGPSATFTRNPGP